MILLLAKPSAMTLADLTLHPLLTAETHNFPTGVAPFPGAETGTGTQSPNLIEIESLFD